MRNPKPETRRPKEGRNPKAEGRKARPSWTQGRGAFEGEVPGAPIFGFRASAILPCYFVLLAALGIGTSAARADSLFLRGGEKLQGKVISVDAAKVVFESQTLGKLEITRDRIERIERDTPTPPPSVAPTNTAIGNTAPAAPLTNQFLPWTSGPSAGEEFDWIQLKSGEWLKGRIKSMQEDKLEFDSEELDLLSFGWDDIRIARSPQLKSVRIENTKPMEGSLLVTPSEVQIITLTATNTYPRADLLAITPTGNRELDKWSGEISAGVSFRAGNTRETDISTHDTLLRRTPETRLSLDFLGNYGKVNGAQTEQNQRLIGQFDYFLSRRLYARVPDVEYFRDPLQNLAHRLTVGGGVGYDLLNTSRVEWNVTTGPAWQNNWFDSVPPGEASSASSLALVLSTRLDFQLTKRLDYILEYRGQLTSQKDGNNTHHMLSTLEFEIHKRLKLDLSFVWDRITSPQTESDGATPTPDDFRLITSLGIDL
jgi:putative salt-induced outer membrane protein YdiY